MRTRIAGLVPLVVVMGTCMFPISLRGADKASDIIADARKAIGGKKLDALKTLSIDASVQRNLGPMQLNTDTELLLELPDKYLRSDVMTGPMSGGSSTVGFIGDKPVQRSATGGGGLVIRMGPGPGPSVSTPKMTPEQQADADKRLLRSVKQDVSRLMLGWFATTHPAIQVQYTFIGEAESPDGKAYVIEAKGGDDFVARLFVDEETHLPLMVTYQAPQPRIVTAGGPRTGGPEDGGHGRADRPATDDERKKLRDDTEKQMAELEKQPQPLADYTLFFDDWRDVDGIKFPHRIRRAMSGVTNEEWTVSKVKVNPKIDPKKFEG
jgi:hypothetical protein